MVTMVEPCMSRRYLRATNALRAPASLSSYTSLLLLVHFEQCHIADSHAERLAFPSCYPTFEHLWLYGHNPCQINPSRFRSACRSREHTQNRPPHTPTMSAAVRVCQALQPLRLPRADAFAAAACLVPRAATCGRHIVRRRLLARHARRRRREAAHSDELCIRIARVAATGVASRAARGLARALCVFHARAVRLALVRVRLHDRTAGSHMDGVMQTLCQSMIDRPAASCSALWLQCGRGVASTCLARQGGRQRAQSNSACKTNRNMAHDSCNTPPRSAQGLRLRSRLVVAGQALRQAGQTPPTGSSACLAVASTHWIKHLGADAWLGRALALALGVCRHARTVGVAGVAVCLHIMGGRASSAQSARGG